MPLKSPENHKLIWSDLLKDISISSSSSWWQVITFLYSKQHGYSNYENCLKRNHDQVRADVFGDPKIKEHIESAEDNLTKVEAVLDEMCHLLTSQCNPSRKLKFAGVFFIKCITNIYSSIYVNNHFLPLTNVYKLEQNLFRQQYLSISRELPVVILPTHRSYMDFLFVSYIMTHFELPLPIVATGDNFKAMGSMITNYLKGTGAFLVRRNANRKKDIDANVYYEILRAYVHSLVRGGENPIEFFMEGTRTRVGQVLRPKTGLLSMVADLFVSQNPQDVYILPVSINYQRPIEEQLYVGENTPQINMAKPKESAKNLLNGFEAIMKRKYGKVYVRFFEPFKLSDYFAEWKAVTKIDLAASDVRDDVLHDFTNSLASKVCLAQANNNILMPFNLISCSILARSFLRDTLPGNNNDLESFRNLRVAKIVEDFYSIEKLLQSTQEQFVPGWQSHLEILDEFKLDRDQLLRPSSDRRFVEFNSDALTFQTMLYYSNQLLQILLPVAICFVLSGEVSSKWEQYKSIRTLLSKDFFSNDSFMRQEFELADKSLKDYNITGGVKRTVVIHLYYFVKCYSTFLIYLKQAELFVSDEFFEHAVTTDCLYISKDMLKNMVALVQDYDICATSATANGAGTKQQSRVPEQISVTNVRKLEELIEQFERVLAMTISVMATGTGTQPLN